MMRKYKLMSVFILCLVMAGTLTGCPELISMMKFKIKFLNESSYPVVGAYMVPVTQTGSEPEDWGPNLLPVDQLEEMEYVVFPDEYLKGRYWLMVTLLIDEEEVEIHEDQFVDYHMETTGLREEYVTWRAFDSNTGSGYGWITIPGEIPVAPET